MSRSTIKDPAKSKSSETFFKVLAFSSEDTVFC